MNIEKYKIITKDDNGYSYYEMELDEDGLKFEEKRGSYICKWADEPSYLYKIAYLKYKIHENLKYLSESDFILIKIKEAEYLDKLDLKKELIDKYNKELNLRVEKRQEINQFESEIKKLEDGK